MNKRLALAMMLLSSTTFAADLDKTFPVETKAVFMLEHANGNVTITGTTDSDIHIVTHKVRGGENCITTVDATDGLFDMQTERLDMTIDPCVVDATITVPKAMAIDAVMGNGNITVQGMTGNLNVTVGVGKITTRGSFPRALVQLGVGKLEATWDAMPKFGAITFDIGRGEAILNFPKGSAITTELTPGRADVDVQANDIADASFKVIGSMRSGKVLIQ